MFFSYVNAKRCSNEGRALMQLDFQQLLRRLERIIDDLKYVLKEINQHLFSRLVKLVSIYVYTFD